MLLVNVILAAFAVLGVTGGFLYFVGFAGGAVAGLYRSLFRKGVRVADRNPRPVAVSKH